MESLGKRWLFFIALYLSIFFVLQNLLCFFLVQVGLLLVTGYVTDAIYKAIYNAWPRKLMTNTTDKAVLITGCDSGFGKEVAVKLDKLGFKVYAGCLFPEKEGAQELKELCSGNLEILQLDVTKDQHVADAVKYVTNTKGDRVLWAVVNNAGIATYTEVEWCSVETYRKILDVNALGNIRITKGFLPLLRESCGRVVIVASLAGRYTFPGFSAYSMSKHAAVSFAEGLRREMKKWNVSVHCVEPTLYKTPIATEKALCDGLKNHWDQCPRDIQASYGEEYFQDLENTVKTMLTRAKPVSKIHEVTDDMMDAIAGMNPKPRYVPSLVTQFRARLIASLPMDLQDHLLCQGIPRTPPAAAKVRLPPLKNPYTENLKNAKPHLKRFMSMPMREKHPMETLHENEKMFKF